MLMLILYMLIEIKLEMRPTSRDTQSNFWFKCGQLPSKTDFFKL